MLSYVQWILVNDVQHCCAYLLRIVKFSSALTRACGTTDRNFKFTALVRPAVSNCALTPVLPRVAFNRSAQPSPGPGSKRNCFLYSIGSVAKLVPTRVSLKNRSKSSEGTGKIAYLASAE